MKQEQLTAKRYRIYALVAHTAKAAYISKSWSDDITSTVYRHSHGKVVWTAAYFALDKPVLYILDTVTCTSTEVCNYAAAWRKHFANAGYTILSPAKQHNEDLGFFGQALLARLRNTNLEELLRCVRPTSNPKIDQYVCTDYMGDPVQLNIRTNDTTKHAFNSFAKTRHLYAGDALTLLLNEVAKLEAEDACSELYYQIIEHQSTLYQQREELNRLRATLSKYRAEGAILSSEKHQLEAALTLISGIADWYNKQVTPVDQPIRPIRYKRWKKTVSLQTKQQYCYPNWESGLLVMQIEEVLWGKGRYPAIFILGVGADGTKVKLRFYPKKTHVGISPRHSPFCTRDNMWLFVYQRSNDGAADIVGSLPVFFIDNDAKSTHFYTPISRDNAADSARHASNKLGTTPASPPKLSLGEIVKTAQTRRK